MAYPDGLTPKQVEALELAFERIARAKGVTVEQVRAVAVRLTQPLEPIFATLEKEPRRA